MTTLLTTRYVHRAPFTLHAPLALESMALDMPDANGNPNRIPWRGVLTQVDQPSTRAPQGAHGHRVLIPRLVADAALSSLLGMPVNLAGTRRDHDKPAIVGVITHAAIEGQDIVVGGHLFGKNVPDRVEDIQEYKPWLGMSFEIGDVHVEDVDAPVWTLTHLIFTGAAILEKTAAAYEDTAIAAHAEEGELMGNDVAVIMDELKALGQRIDGLAAAGDDDEEEAKKAAAEAAAKNAADEEAARKKAEEEAARKDADDEDEADAADDNDEEANAMMPALFAMLLRSMRHGRKANAAGEDDEDGTAQALGQALLKAMAYPGAMPTRARKKAAAAAHDDEAEDEALFRRLMKQYGKMDGQQGVVDLATRRMRKEQQELRGAMGLITDTLKKQTGLITDLQQTVKNLATDQGRRMESGPVRKTLAGASWFQGPFDRQEGDQHAVTLEELDSALEKGGLPVGEGTNQQRIAKKLEAQMAGVLKTAQGS